MGPSSLKHHMLYVYFYFLTLHKVKWNIRKCWPIFIYTISTPLSFHYPNTSQVTFRVKGLRPCGGPYKWTLGVRLAMGTFQVPYWVFYLSSLQLEVVPFHHLAGCPKALISAPRIKEGSLRSHEGGYVRPAVPGRLSSECYVVKNTLSGTSEQDGGLHMMLDYS